MKSFLILAALAISVAGNAQATFTFYASETGIIRRFHTESGGNGLILVNDATKRWNGAAWDEENRILYTADMNSGWLYAFTTSVFGGIGYLNAPVAIFDYGTALAETGLLTTDIRSAEFSNGSYFFTGFRPSTATPAGTQPKLYQVQLGVNGLTVTNAGQIATLRQTNGTDLLSTMQSGDFVLNGTELYFASNGNSKNYYRYDIAGRVGSFGNSANLSAVFQAAQAGGYNAMTRGAVNDHYVYSSATDTYYSFNPVNGAITGTVATGLGHGTGDATLYTAIDFRPVPEPQSMVLSALGLGAALAARRKRAAKS